MKKKIILITLLFFSFLILSSCFFGGDNGGSSVKKNIDEYNYSRPTENTLIADAVILDKATYDSANKIEVGNGGNFGLLNSIFNNSSELNTKDNYYFVGLVYGLFDVDTNPEFETFFNVECINDNGIFSGNEVIETINFNYKNIYFNERCDDCAIMNMILNYNSLNDSYNKFNIKIDYYDYGFRKLMFFSFVLEFKIKEEGQINFNFNINEDKLRFDYKFNKEYSIGNFEIGEHLINVNDYKVSFISESIIEDGIIDDEKLTEQANFVKGFSKLMVIDIDTKTIKDNDGTNKLNVLVKTNNYDKFNTKIEEVPSNDFSEEVIDNVNNLKVSLAIPRENNTDKAFRLIYKINPLENDNSEIKIYITSSNMLIDNYKSKIIPVRVSNDGLIFGNDGLITGVMDDTISEINIKAYHNGSLVKIGEGAFKDCENLLIVNIEEGVTEIQKEAFAGCTALQKINFPSTISNISATAFNNCPNNLFNEDNGLLYIGNDSNPYYILLKPIDNKLEKYNINANSEKMSNECFENCYNLSSINLYGIKNIGDYAFYDCNKLNNIIFNNVEEIGEYAFARCNFKSLVLPTKLKTLGHYAFYECDNLEAIIFNEQLETAYESIYGCDNMKNYLFKGENDFNMNIPNDSYVEYDVLYNSIEYIIVENNYSYFRTNTDIGIGFKLLNKEIEIIELPKIIKNILPATFRNCNLKEATVYLEEVPNDAFRDCESLIKINLKGNLTKIGSNAFSGCEKLTTINLNDKIEYIGAEAFSNCKSLESIHIPTSIGEIPNNLFYGCESLLELVIPENITNIGEGALTGCKSLTKLTLPFIGEKLGTEDSKNKYPAAYPFGYYNSTDFYGITYDLNYYDNVYYYIPKSLKELTILNCSYLGPNYFKEYESLEKINFVNFNYKYLPENIFDNCTSLKTITIPNSIKNIGSNAFKDCKALESIYFGKNVNIISKNAFTGCYKLKGVNYDGTIEDWCNIDFYDGFSNPMLYASEFYMKNSYDNYILMEELIIPDTVTTIKSSQFYGFNYPKIVIGKNVKEIQYDAFSATFNNLYYNGSLEDWCAIKIVSNPLKNVENFYIKDSNDYKLIKDLIIPNTISSIGEHQFDGLKMENLTFGDNIKSIKELSFDNTNLKNVYYDGTIEDWCEISFDSITSNPMYYATNIYLLDSLGSISFNNKSYKLIEDLIIPDSILSIGDYQFYNFNSIVNVEISNSVTTIGKSSFSLCNSIKKMKLPFIGEKEYLETDSTQTSLSFLFDYDEYNKIVFKPEALEEIEITNSLYLPINALKSFSSIKKITLPSNLKIIGDYSLSNLNLEEIELPSNLEKINNCAFQKCTALKEINIPQSVNSIGTNAFMDCISLINVNLPNSITTISDSMFENCTSLEEIILPDSVESIGNRAFYNSSSLKNVNQPVALKNIGSYSFYKTCLENVILQEEVEIIGNNAFDNSSIKTLVLPRSIKSIYNNFFGDKFSSLYYNGTVEDWSKIEFVGDTLYSNPMMSAKHFYILDSNGEIEYNELKYSTLTDIFISQELTEIGIAKFVNLNDVINISIPKSINKINPNAFDCKNVENIYYDGNIDDWYNIDLDKSYFKPLYYASNFYILDSNGSLIYNNKNYSILESITISSNINSIDKLNYKYMKNVKNLIIPNNITSISEGVFNGMSNLETITLPFVGDNKHEPWETFDSSKFDQEATEDYYTFGYIFGKIEYVGGIKTSQNYYKKGEININNGIASYYIPNTLKEINVTDSEYLTAGAFMNCKNVININLNNSLTSIGGYSFVGCEALEKIIIKSNVKNIGKYAFSNVSCPIIFETNLIEEIFAYAFANYKGETINLPESVKTLRSYSFKNSSIKNIKIGSNITALQGFDNCSSLESVIIPKTITMISSYCFDGCSSLKDIYYEGSMDEWNKITIGSFNNPLSKATIHYLYTI